MYPRIRPVGLPGLKKGRGREGGFILILCVIALILIAGMSSAFLTLSLQDMRAATAQVANANAFYAAESALNEAVLRISSQFERAVVNPSDIAATFASVDAVDSPNDAAESVYTDPGTGMVFQDFPFGSGTATVWVRNTAVIITDSFGKPFGEARDVEVIATGTVNGVTFSVQKNLRAQVTNTHKFDFGLLAHELPECMFCHLEIRGDVGQVSPTQFKMWSAYDRAGYDRSAVYGDFYVKGTYSSTSRETNGASNGQNQERMVTDQGGNIYQSYTGDKLSDWGEIRSYFEPGAWFDTLSTSQAAKLSFALPPALTLGDAIANQTSFMAVMAAGTSLATTTPSIPIAGPIVNGHLILIGTPANPIVLDDAVTVHGDVVIKGTVKGIGNINASGNIYITDSIVYAKPPSNILKAEDGASDGTPADKLGLASASNILVGDMTDQKTGRFLNVQFVDVNGSGYEWVPAEFLNNNYAFDDARDLTERTASGGRTISTPGLLPVGATGGMYKSSMGIDFAGGWISRSLLAQISNTNLNRVDATLFADYAIAGGQPNATSIMTINGGSIGKEIGILAAKYGASAFRINYDSRNRLGNPLGFPMEQAIIETGWMRIPPKL